MLNVDSLDDGVYDPAWKEIDPEEDLTYDSNNKLLRFIAENPRFVLDNYNPEQVMNNGHVDVPVRELQKLEESRIKLFDFINES